MFKSFILLFTCCLTCTFFSLYAQVDQFEKFTRLESKGDIPEDFIRTAKEEYEKDVQNNTNPALNNDFFVSTRFEIKNLLLGGQILFNEELSNYVNKVAKTLVRKDPALSNKLRFYVIKSDYVNAFSTDQGIIFVSSGLIAQLENEAQLAFILAHEIAHFSKGHVRDRYVNNQSYLGKRSARYNLSKSEILELLSDYSKENELDADISGIDLLAKTKYSIEEVLSAFDILLYSYLPFDDIHVDTNYFWGNQLTLPSYYYPDSILPITKTEDYDDRNSTHPNIKKRIDAAFDYLESGKVKSTGDQLFIVTTEDKFRDIRNLARFENVNQKMIKRKYVDAIYLIYLLERDFPNNHFLKLSLVKSLYGLAVYKRKSRYREVTTKPEKIEGESYKFHALFANLNGAQLSVMALRYAYDFMVLYPADQAAKDYYEAAKINLAKTKDVDFDYFSDAPFGGESDTTSIVLTAEQIDDSIKVIDNSDLSKYQKIKLKKELNLLLKKEQASAFVTDFHYFGISDIMTSTNIISELKGLKKDEEEDKISDNSVDKVIILDPMIFFHGNSNSNYLKSDRKQEHIKTILLRDYKKLKLEKVLLSARFATSDHVSKYNDLGLVYQWAEEMFNHDDLQIITSSQPEMKTLGQNFGASKILFWFVTVDNVKIPHVEIGGIVVDLNTGRSVKEIYRRTSIRPTNKNIEVMMYYLLSQVATNTVEE